MITTNRDRQASYRDRHLAGDDAKKVQLSMVIDGQVKQALVKLAKCYGVTMREFIERIILAADKAADTALSASAPGDTTDLKKLDFEDYAVTALRPITPAQEVGIQNTEPVKTGKWHQSEFIKRTREK